MSLSFSQYNSLNDRSFPIGTGTIENDHLSVLMGTPFTMTAGGAERNLWRSHKDFPDAMKQAIDNSYWADTVIAFGLMDLDVYGTLICPTEYVTQIDFRWRQRRYQRSILDYNPEETTARMLSQNEESFEARLVRRGLMAQMEVGYARTAQGAQDWINQTQAFIDSTQLTIAHEVLWSIMNARRSPQIYEQMHGLQSYDIYRRLEYDAVWHGAATLTPAAFNVWDVEAKRHAVQVAQFVPDVYIAEPRGLVVAQRGPNAYHHVHREYLFVGPDGRRAMMPAAANQWNINGTPMYVTPAFSSLDGAEHIPNTVKTSIVSSYFLMLDTFASSGDQRKRKLSDRTIVFHDEDDDDDRPFELTTAIMNDNVWDEATGEIHSLVDRWRNYPTKKSCPWVFKWGNDGGQQFLEKCRFFGQMEDWALDGQTIRNVATSSLADLSDEDLNNINALFETFRDIRDCGQSEIIADIPSEFRARLYALEPAQIRNNAALASFVGLEALAAKEPETTGKYMLSFKLMVRKLDFIFGKHSHVTDGSQCPLFWRDITKDRSACTAWHFIVDEGTAPTFYENSANRAGRSAESVFGSLDEVREAISKNPSAVDFGDHDQRDIVEKILAALRRVSATHLKDLEDKKNTQFQPSDAIIIRAPLGVLGYFKAASGNPLHFQEIAKAAIVDVDKAEKLLAELNGDGVIRMKERLDAKVASIPGLDVTDAKAAWSQQSNARYKFNIDLDVTMPSPYVITANSLNLRGVRPADPNTGYSTPLVGEIPRTMDQFYSLFHRARPSVYSKNYPAENYAQSSYSAMERDPDLYAPSASTTSADMGSWLAAVGMAAEPRQVAYTAAPRQPVRAGGNDKDASIRHGHWFLNEAKWSQSGSFVNNWNRIMGTTDVPTRVAMATFLFSRLTRETLLSMCEKGNVAVPYQAMLVKIAHAHDYGSYILTKSGPDLGITAWTNPLSMTESHTNLMMIEWHFALYVKTLIKNPQFIVRWDCAYFCGYKGGGGHRVYTMADIEAWHINHHIPVRFARFAPSIMVIQIAPSEKKFRQYIDLSGHFPAWAMVGDDTAPHYSSADFYAERYYFGIMNPSKPGFHAFYPGPVAPRITYQGRWKYADPMQGFAWTENKGHLKNEYPGIGKVRAGHLLNEPRQQGATVLA